MLTTENYSLISENHALISENHTLIPENYELISENYELISENHVTCTWSLVEVTLSSSPSHTLRVFTRSINCSIKTGREV